MEFTAALQVKAEEELLGPESCAGLTDDHVPTRAQEPGPDLSGTSAWLGVLAHLPLGEEAQNFQEHFIKTH